MLKTKALNITKNGFECYEIFNDGQKPHKIYGWSIANISTIASQLGIISAKRANFPTSLKYDLEAQFWAVLPASSIEFFEVLPKWLMVYDPAIFVNTGAQGTFVVIVYYED